MTSHELALDDRKPFLHSRLASALAILPLSVWTFFHIWQNLSAFKGAEAWQKSVTEYAHPVSQWLTFIIVLLPLLIHTAWGIARLKMSRPNNLRYGYYSNLKFLLQRLSALGILLFLGAHLWLAFLRPRLILGHPEFFHDIAHEMRHHLPTLIVYLLGTLGVAYHLANGIATLAMSWGFVVKRKSLQRVERFSISLFVVFLTMSWAAIYALWNAGA